jgi:hypothetical protein
LRSAADRLAPSATARFIEARPNGSASAQATPRGNGLSFDPAIPANGRFVAFESPATNLVPGDTNGWFDVFVHDRQTGKTRRVSVSTGGAQGNINSFNAATSADGRFVAFGSYATNLVPGDTNDTYDVFVRTLAP